MKKYNQEEIDKIQELKNSIIKWAKKHDACDEEVKRVKVATSIQEIYKVVVDNLGFCLNHKLKLDLDRKEVWSQITDDEYRCRYCSDVKDRKELWSQITSDVWRLRYCRDVKDRKELK